KKTLLLIRHAKSSWDNTGIDDFDRPLNDRGKRDAPEMAARLIKLHQGIDLFVSSPAKRAKKTAELFMKEFRADEKKIIVVPSLYHATPRDFTEAILEFANRYGSIAVFSHNPGITSFDSSLTEVQIDNMPTCSIFALTIAGDSWTNFNESPKTFLFFDYPKANSKR